MSGRWPLPPDVDPQAWGRGGRAGDGMPSPVATSPASYGTRRQAAYGGNATYDGRLPDSRDVFYAHVDAAFIDVTVPQGQAFILRAVRYIERDGWYAGAIYGDRAIMSFTLNGIPPLAMNIIPIEPRENMELYLLADEGEILRVSVSSNPDNPPPGTQEPHGSWRLFGQMVSK